MSYSANSYNYATPLSSSAGFVGAAFIDPNTKLFTLDDNTLDGSYVPITGDVGLWSASISDDSGILSTPFVVTIVDDITTNAYRVVGSADCYPVAFTIEFYKGSNLLYTITETTNDTAEYVCPLPSSLTVTSVVVTVTKISKANAAARLYNVYNIPYVRSTDTLRVSNASRSTLSSTTVKTLMRSDKIILKHDSSSGVRNIIDVANDILHIKQVGASTPTNVHTRMKDPYRKIYGKVYITYTDPMLDNETVVLSDYTAYNSNVGQVTEGLKASNPNFFTLYENNLTGNYVLSDRTSPVGWTSSLLSNTDGTFDIAPAMTVSFAARPITSLDITFEDSRGNIVENFTVTFIDATGDEQSVVVTGNSAHKVSLESPVVSDIVAIKVTITKISKAGYPASVLAVPLSSTILYEGYADHSTLMSIDMLEELTYEDDIEALGGISANEVTVVLDNSKQDFYFNNTNSYVATQMKRHRKIVPWLGTEIVPGEIEWYTLGTYWAYKWDVPVNGLTATVVGFDTIGLLDMTLFTKHQTQVNKSIGWLVEYILEDARNTFSFIEYSIDPSLYDVVIPYAWFEAASHTAALRKLSLSFPVHVYCDRQGRICAAPQKLRLDYFKDTWSDSTNIIDKSYSSLYTALPNIINVTVSQPSVVKGATLTTDNIAFTVNGVLEKQLNFQQPYLSNLSVSVECDATVSYTYEVFSWGIELTFTGSGVVRSIVCTGTAVAIVDSSVVTVRNAESIRINGAITRSIQSPFIQTISMANTLIERLQTLSEYDRYDASVKYRGDIALSINDPIRLLDGIAPDNRYNIKRHELSWNGALTGSADLNT